MNFRTESLDFPQKEQRRCRSWDMDVMDRGQASQNRKDSWMRGDPFCVPDDGTDISFDARHPDL